jgi:hypothetical protein
MKKTIVVTLLVLGALALLSTGIAAAQTPQPPMPGGGAGNGTGGGRMRFEAAYGSEGPLHDYMVNAMAEALGISADEFESRRDAGATAYQIALDLGVSADKIPTLLSAARAKAVDAAAANNAISQQQADWMKSRPAGMVVGNCSGTGQPMGQGMGRGWRFQQSAP